MVKDNPGGENAHGVLQLAIRGDINLRGLKVALVVGTVLAAINHGDRLWAADVNGELLGKIVLTYFVPYLVSMWSSVQALRKLSRSRSQVD